MKKRFSEGQATRILRQAEVDGLHTTDNERHDEIIRSANGKSIL